jgi:hypothetical protein
MDFGKSAEPIGGKIHRYTDRQNAGSLLPHNAFAARRDLVECIANHGKIVASCLGDHQPLALPIQA